MSFLKHKNVSTACRFTSLRPYVLAPLLFCALMSVPFVCALMSGFEVLPQSCLIIAKQGLALNSTDATEISYFLDRLEIRFQTPNNRSLF